ncbi:hypothetical protein [Lysobacter antibioticus]|uniref:hypothetical protein n=1 Tax=Lysobacter antibioticus TaxID=84531 RepID=UPI00034BDB9D|nr:hypothetical protein [Lysobacter antibioticus]
MKAVLLALAVPLAATAQAPSSPAADAAPGGSVATAIEVCEPQGQHRYLARLVCPDRSHPQFERAGSVGERTPLPAHMTEAQSVRLVEAMLAGKPLAPGEPDHHVVDRYRVVCGTRETSLYLDMYHCDRPPPRIAPAGFELID